MDSVLIDTSPEAKRQYYQRLREMTPTERLERMLSIIAGMSEIISSQIKQRNPTLTKAEFRYQYALRFHGRAIADEHFRVEPEV